MNETERAYERALSFLERRDRTEREVADRLASAGFSEAAVEGALAHLREAGLVDDPSYAVRYLEALVAKRRGRLRIVSEMRRKGLPEDLVRYTIEDGITPEDERERALAEAKRIMEGIPGDMEKRKAEARVNRRLVTLGFPYDVIGETMHRIASDEPE